jgi:hypothetical protein
MAENPFMRLKEHELVKNPVEYELIVLVPESLQLRVFLQKAGAIPGCGIMEDILPLGAMRPVRGTPISEETAERVLMAFPVGTWYRLIPATVETGYIDW